MSVYQLRSFADIVAAVREELGVQSTDTTRLNRIKRDINAIYQEVTAEKNWWWLEGHVTAQLAPYVSAGTVSVVQGSATATLSVAPGPSKRSHYFAVDGFDEIYIIESHTAGSTTVKLSELYSGATSTTAKYKIWTDRVALPTDCKETTEVWHNYHSKPLDPCGKQEFRKISAMAPRAEGKPAYYYTGDFRDPGPVSSISSLPAVSTRASSGVVKTIVFASGLPSAVTAKYTAGEPIRWRITAAGSPSYNGEIFVSSISTTTATNDTITYTGRGELQESATADSSLTVEQIDQEADFDRYRELYLYPAITSSRITLNVDYIKEILPLENDSDEPAIPLQDRFVLVYGALARQWDKLGNDAKSAKNDARYREKLAKMAGKLQDTFDTPQLIPHKTYLSTKRNPSRRAGFSDGRVVLGGGGGGSSVPTGTVNTVATFDSSGELAGSATISTTELGYLDGVSSNIQTQLDAITTLADGKIYIGNGSNAATEVTPSGDITISNSGVTAITAGVIVDADINASAAIAKSKLAAGTASRVEVTDGSGVLTESAITSTELTYLDDVEALTPAALNDNQAAAANVATWTAASFDTVQLKYSIKRGTNFESGIIVLTTDGTSAAIAQGAIASLGTVGVTLTADVSAGSLRLRYTSTSTGTAPTFKYKLSKWLA